MRRPTRESLKKKNDIIAIAVIKGLINEGRIPEAIDVAEKRKLAPEQFGKITSMTELSAEEIYKRIIAEP